MIDYLRLFFARRSSASIKPLTQLDSDSSPRSSVIAALVAGVTTTRTGTSRTVPAVFGGLPIRGMWLILDTFQGMSKQVDLHLT